MQSATTVFDNDLNLKATELRLGLPGSDEPQSSKNNKRSCSETDSNPEKTKAQVVGWPPVRSFRKNVMKKPDPESGSGFFVKVSMDGAPYLRKIDLKFYSSYFDLLEALEKMFECRIGSDGSEHAPTYEDKDGDWMLVGDVPWDMFVTSCKRLRIMRSSEAKGLGCLY